MRASTAMFITGGMLIVAFLCISPPSASEDLHNVFVFVPEGEYDLGSKVPVNISVLTNGYLTDPDELTAHIEEYDGTNRTLDVTRVGSGRYTCDLRLQLNDTDEGGTVWAYAIARFGDTTVGGHVYFHTVFQDAFQAQAILTDPDDLVAQPGQSIEFDMKVTFKGEPVDPDPGSMVAYLVEEGHNGTMWYRPLVLARKDKGLYNGTFLIPPGGTESTEYLVYVYMNVTIDGRTWVDPSWGDLLLRVPVYFYRVWAHQGNVTRESADLTLYFEDLEGNAVVGGDVDLVFMETELNGTTDGEGIVRFHLTYENMEPADWFDVDSSFDKSGLRQYFWVRVRLPPPTSSHRTDGFRIRGHADEPLPVHEEVSIDLIVTTDGEPVSGFQLFVFIVSDEGLLFNAALVTDGEGIAHVRFTTGGTHVNMIYFHWEDGPYGSRFHRSNQWFHVDVPYDVNVLGWFDGGTTISVEPFPPGGPVEVTFENPDADGTAETATVVWAVGDLADYRDDDYYPPWFNWEPMYANTYPYYPVGNVVAAQWDGEAYRATIVLPPFLPPDVRIFVMGLVEFMDSPYRDIRGALLENVTATLPHARPAVEVRSPADGEVHHGVVEVAGNATGVVPVQLVEVQVGGREWVTARGTDAWNLSLGPGELASGVNTIRVRAFDGQVWSRVASVTFTFDAPPTVWIDEPPEGSVLGGLVSIEGRASDDVSLAEVEVRLDGGEWTVVDGSDNWTWPIDTRTLEHGRHLVEARAFDGFTRSAVASRLFLADQPPVIVSDVPASVEALEDLPFTLDLEAEDDGGGGLTWSDDSDLFDVDPGTGSISFVPGQEDVGTHEVTVTVMDGNGGTDSLTFELVVIEVNDPPEFVNEAPQQASVYEDQVTSLLVSARDEEDDQLTWSCDCERFPISPTTGWIRFDPTQEDVGEWWFNVTVTDSGGLTDHVSFSIVVVNVNDAPVIVSLFPENGTKYGEGKKVTFTVSATDEDGDDMTVTWVADGKTLGTGTTLEYGKLKPGTRVVMVSVFDGTETTEGEITLVIRKSEEGPGFGVVAVCLAMMGGVVVAERRRRGRA